MLIISSIYLLIHLSTFIYYYWTAATEVDSEPIRTVNIEHTVDTNNNKVHSLQNMADGISKCTNDSCTCKDCTCGDCGCGKKVVCSNGKCTCAQPCSCGVSCNCGGATQNEGDDEDIGVCTNDQCTCKTCLCGAMCGCNKWWVWFCVDKNRLFYKYTAITLNTSCTR